MKHGTFETSFKKQYRKLSTPVQTTLLLFLCTIFSAMDCTKKDSGNNMPLLFDSIPISHPVIPVIKEGSGIADSKLNPGNIWVEEDSGNPPQIILVKYDGTLVKKIYMEGAVNRDWEDMALYNDTIYVADIGDNNQVYKSYTFYSFPEPSSTMDTVKNIKTVSFIYPDGSHDAEAFLLDRKTLDIYIITKRDNPSRIYKLSYPYAALVNTVAFVGTLNYTGVVSATASNDEKEVIVKTYFGLNYYNRNNSQSIIDCLMQSPRSLPYIAEPQGEAVCFAQNNNGFFTLSEKGMASFVKLYFYSRK